LLVDLILQALCPERTKRAKFLDELRVPTRELWNRLRKAEPTVDYSDDDYQSSYMLRYFAPYSQILPDALAKLKKILGTEILPSRKEIAVCFLGPGPCPEVFGLCQYIAANRLDVQRIDAYTFDLHSSSWKRCRAIVREVLIPGLIKGIKCRTIPKSLDMRIHADLETALDSIVKHDLIVAQHFWNELPGDLAIVQFKRIVKKPKSGCPMLIIESGTDERRQQLMKDLSESARLLGLATKEIPPTEKYPERGDLIELPQIVKTNLFVETDGLWYRRKIAYSGLLVWREDSRRPN
jgi:hypothetical protein